MANYRKVSTFQDYQEMLEEAQNCEYAAYDTETTSLNPRKGKIIGISISTEFNSGWYLPVYNYAPKKDKLEEAFYVDPSDKSISVSGFVLAKIIIKALLGKKLIMHNASFDVRYTKAFFGIDLLDSVFADSMLLVHTVQEGGVPPIGGFALKDIAVSIQHEIGIDVEKQANEEQKKLKASIHANGGSTTKTSYEIWKADPDLLAEYAAADTDLTLKVAFHFFKKLKEEGLGDFFFKEEVMPIYREVTIPMEMDGIKLDMALLKESEKSITRDILTYKEEVTNKLTSDPRFREWLFDKITRKYPPTPKGKFAKALLDLYDIDIPLRKKEIEKLPDSLEIKAFLLTGDATTIKDPKKLLGVSLALWKEENEGELINIQAKQQLGTIIFEYFKEKPLSSTKKGSPQFDDDMLDKLAEKYDWARSLQIYNKLVKIRSAYIERFLEESEDGRFYPYFKQHGTVSGRYGSNLQQLPKPLEEDQHDPIVVTYTNLIRRFFISDDDHVFIDCDYQSLEPHIFASITGDNNLQEVFNKGLDFYSYVAIKTKGLQGVSADMKADNYLKKVNPVERQEAKPYALGMAYGMSPYALAMTLGKTPKEGEKLHRGYLQGFPGVADWIEESRRLVQAQGFIKNKLGRVRHLPEVKELYEIFGNSLMDWRARKGYEKDLGQGTVQKAYQEYRNGMNSLLNFQIQSMAASVVNRAALQVNRYLKENNIPGKVIAQIHDQLLIQVPTKLAKKAAKEVQRIMETTTTLSGVTLKAPPEIATNFYEGH